MENFYVATVAQKDGLVFDRIEINADTDLEARKIAFKWASGRGRNYTVSLVDMGREEPRYIAFKDY